MQEKNLCYFIHIHLKCTQLWPAYDRSTNMEWASWWYWRNQFIGSNILCIPGCAVCWTTNYWSWSVYWRICWSTIQGWHNNSFIIKHMPRWCLFIECVAISVGTRVSKTEMDGPVAGSHGIKNMHSIRYYEWIWCSGRRLWRLSFLEYLCAIWWCEK